MKWSKLKGEDGKIIPRVIASDTMPAYKIARFSDAGVDTYRASLGGEFVGGVFATVGLAQAMCDRHSQIMQPTAKK